MGLPYFSQFSYTKLKRTLNFMYLFACSPQSEGTMGSWSGHHSRMIGNLKINKTQQKTNKQKTRQEIGGTKKIKELNILEFSFFFFFF